MSKTANQERSTSKELDQYYTNPDYARDFYNEIQNFVKIDDYDTILEPSAGTGNFYSLFPEHKRIGLDLDPKYPGVIQHDFLKWYPDNLQSNILAVGNPPFGKNARLAVDFYNHCGKFCNAIGFIVPRTFRKASVINRLNPYFHLVYDVTSPDNSFIYNDNPYDVWCTGQLWIRKPYKREKIKIYKLNEFVDWFEIVEPAAADFAIQRVGGAAGLIRTESFRTYSDQSHYFIKQKQSFVLDVFEKVDFENVKYNTAGNPSISPSEMLELWLAKATELGYDIITNRDTENNTLFDSLFE